MMSADEYVGDIHVFGKYIKAEARMDTTEIGGRGVIGEDRMEAGMRLNELGVCPYAARTEPIAVAIMGVAPIGGTIVGAN